VSNQNLQKKREGNKKLDTLRRLGRGSAGLETTNCLWINAEN